MKQKYKELVRNWTECSIGGSVNIQRGFAFKSEDYVNDGVLNFRVTNIKENGQIDTKDVKYLPKYFLEKYQDFVLKEDDIVLVMVGATTGKIGKISKEILPALLNQNMWNLKPKEVFFNKNFFFYLINFNIRHFLNKAGGSAREFLRQKEFVKFIVLSPSQPEQGKIAEILSTVDEAIEKTDAINEETNQLKKGLMQKLFTGGIGHTRFKETKIGKIPEEWEVERLGRIGEFFKGKTITKSEITETGFPCIRYGDIYVQYEFANIVTHFSAYINEETAKNGRRLLKNDIIFAGTGETQEDIGKCVAYTKDDKAFAGGDLIVFRPSKDIGIDSEFLSSCLNTGEVAKRKSRLGQGLSIFHIYSTHLQTLEIPLPSFSEQRQIAQILSELDAKIEKEMTTKKQLEKLKKGLMQVLLTGKIRVKV